MIPRPDNNYCGLDKPSDYNFETWDNWAKTQSANKDVKVFIGAPGSSSSAGSGYVDASTLAQYAKEAQEKYSSFGGVMLWDASTAYSMYSAALSDVCERLIDVDAQPTTGTTRASRRPCLAPTLRQAVRAPRQPRPL